MPLVCCINLLDSSEGPQAVWKVQSPHTQICSWADSCTVLSRRLCQAAPRQLSANTREKGRTSNTCCYWTIRVNLSPNTQLKTQLCLLLLCLVFICQSNHACLFFKPIYLTQSVSSRCSWCFWILFLQADIKFGFTESKQNLPNNR